MGDPAGCGGRSQSEADLVFRERVPERDGYHRPARRARNRGAGIVGGSGPAAASGSGSIGKPTPTAKTVSATGQQEQSYCFGGGGGLMRPSSQCSSAFPSTKRHIS